MFISTSQIEPGLFHFLLLFCDAFDFQYQSLAVLCSYLRKVTESQKSFTKNIDEKLTQVHWKEQKASLFLLELSVFCETHWFCCDLYFFLFFLFFTQMQEALFLHSYGEGLCMTEFTSCAWCCRMDCDLVGHGTNSCCQPQYLLQSGRLTAGSGGWCRILASY